MCNSFSLQKWQAAILNELKAEGHELSLIIINSRPPKPKRKWFPFPTTPPGKWLYQFCNRYFFRPAWRQTVDLQDEVQAVPQIVCEVVTRDFSQFFSADDVDFISNQNLDFILRFGFNIVRGDILTAARYGVWSFHHGDEQTFRGGPPGFWEMYHAKHTTGVILQRITHRLDAGIVLKKYLFTTVRHSYTSQLDNLLSNSIPMVRQVCNDIVHDRAEYLSAPSSKSNAPVYRIPGNWKMTLFLIKQLRNRFLFHWTHTVLSEQWNLGLIDAPAAKVAFNWKTYRKRVRWFPPLPKHEFRADGFLISVNDHLKLLCERFNYHNNKGYIEQIILTEDISKADHGLAISEKKHISFPFTFNFKDDVFCVPENSASGLTKLYLFNKDTEEFDFLCDLLPEPVIDPVLHLYEGRWWLFGTLPSNPSGALYVWYADSLPGPYIPHQGNPVKVDNTSCRSAGPVLQADKVLFRPAQNSSKTYGGSIVINQILTLTPEEFNEQPVVDLMPDDDWIFSEGIHTISGQGKLTVIDAKRYRFVARAFISRLLRKLT